MQDTEYKFDASRIKLVPINQVRPNPWNPKPKNSKEFKDVLFSVKTFGLQDYVIVRTKLGQTDNDIYELLDGEQRWSAALQLGHTHILVYDMGEISDKDAITETILKQIHVEAIKSEVQKLMNEKLQDLEKIKEDFFKSQNQTTTKVKQKTTEQMVEKMSKEQVKPEAPKGEILKNFSLQCNTTQYEIITQALKKANKKSNIEALEYICAEFLAKE